MSRRWIVEMSLIIEAPSKQVALDKLEALLKKEEHVVKKIGEI